MDLLAFGNPEAWLRVLSADQLVEANKAEMADAGRSQSKPKESEMLDHRGSS